MTNVKSILHNMGYKYLKSGPSAQLPASDAAATQEQLKQKIAYQRVRPGAAEQNVWNIDETAVKLLPLADKCWTERASIVKDSKRQISVVLATSTQPGTSSVAKFLEIIVLSWNAPKILEIVAFLS